jgi:hypothetical protein
MLKIILKLIDKQLIREKKIKIKEKAKNYSHL